MDLWPLCVYIHVGTLTTSLFDKSPADVCPKAYFILLESRVTTHPGNTYEACRGHILCVLSFF